ncbi:MAG: esterase-like activity of phytase family protein, partial [Pseudomonadota bacterium]
LLFTLQAGGIADTIDNLEGMTFGPEIDGARTLVLVSDNNFNPNGQFTQFLLFKIIE